MNVRPVVNIHSFHQYAEYPPGYSRWGNNHLLECFPGRYRTDDTKFPQYCIWLKKIELDLNQVLDLLHTIMAYVQSLQVKTLTSDDK